jgi:hypothetical protein
MTEERVHDEDGDVQNWDDTEEDVEEEEEGEDEQDDEEEGLRACLRRFGEPLKDKATGGLLRRRAMLLGRTRRDVNASLVRRAKSSSAVNSRLIASLGSNVPVSGNTAAVMFK